MQHAHSDQNTNRMRTYKSLPRVPNMDASAAAEAAPVTATTPT